MRSDARCPTVRASPRGQAALYNAELAGVAGHRLEEARRRVEELYDIVRALPGERAVPAEGAARGTCTPKVPRLPGVVPVL